MAAEAADPLAVGEYAACLGHREPKRSQLFVAGGVDRDLAGLGRRRGRRRRALARGRLGDGLRGGLIGDRRRVDGGQRLGDLVGDLTGSGLGRGGAALGLGDLVEHLAKLTLALGLPRPALGQLLRLLGPRLGLRGSRLDLLQPGGGTGQRVVSLPLALGQALLGEPELAGQGLLLGAALLKVVLRPMQLGEQRLAFRREVVVRGALTLLGVAPARLDGLLGGSFGRLGLPRGLRVDRLGFLGGLHVVALGLPGRLVHLGLPGVLALGVAAALGLGQSRQRLALGGFADRLLVRGGGDRDRAGGLHGSGLGNGRDLRRGRRGDGRLRLERGRLRLADGLLRLGSGRLWLGRGWLRLGCGRLGLGRGWLGLRDGLHRLNQGRLRLGRGRLGLGGARLWLSRRLYRRRLGGLGAAAGGCSSVGGCTGSGGGGSGWETDCTGSGKGGIGPGAGGCGAAPGGSCATGGCSGSRLVTSARLRIGGGTAGIPWVSGPEGAPVTAGVAAPAAATVAGRVEAPVGGPGAPGAAIGGVGGAGAPDARPLPLRVARLASFCWSRAAFCWLSFWRRSICLRARCSFACARFAFWAAIFSFRWRM